jgi:threonine dehydrogenase-like Zn-dependent dehydrogenase
MEECPAAVGCRIQVKPMITHRLGLSRWEEGFEAMANKEAIKVILTYDFD